MPIVMGILDDIRKAIKASKISRYRMAQDTGIPESQLCRLMSGANGLSIQSLERLAAYLGLTCVISPKSPRRKKGE